MCLATVLDYSLYDIKLDSSESAHCNNDMVMNEPEQLNRGRARGPERAGGGLEVMYKFEVMVMLLILVPNKR